MSAPRNTCSKCNAIKVPGKPCKPCQAQYIRQYRADGRYRAVKPVFRRTKKINFARYAEIFDTLSGELLHAGLYANAQEAYDAMLLQRGHSPGCESTELDSWIDDSSIYVKMSCTA